MNLQTYKTTLSRSNQTAVPAYIISKLGLTAGDNLIWNLDPVYKTIKIKQAPKDWGEYLSGLGSGTWKNIDVEEHIKQGRQDRVFK
ncbi:MAG: hypothetical protein AAB625_00775 [Patescibacteria group bacterium]|mgnify:CR=1 FL=1